MIDVRQATIADSNDIFIWRNDEHTRLMSINSKPVLDAEHEHWFKQTLENNNKCLLICTNSQQTKIAVVRFDIDKHTAEISINIAPKWRGKGLAKKCLQSAIKYLKNNFPALSAIRAHIKLDNTASQKCFLALGFKLTATNDNLQFYTLQIKGDNMPSYEDRINELRKYISELGAQEAHTMQQAGAIIIDVRTRAEYDTLHIKDAIYLGRDFLEFKIAEIAPNSNTKIILACGGGSRSLFAAESLISLGYNQVYNLQGGFKAWHQNDLPTQS